MVIPKLIHLWNMKVKGKLSHLGRANGVAYLQLKFLSYNREFGVKTFDSAL